MARNDDHIIRYGEGRRKHLGKIKNRTTTISDFKDLFREPMRTRETYRQYLKLDEDEQKRLKGLNGYFFRAPAHEERRRKDATLPSDMVTLDFDYATPSFLQELQMGVVFGDLEWMLHTSRRHTPERPRIRLVIFLKTRLPKEAYPAVSRILAEMCDPEMKMVDPVSFRVAQMMFMPTVSSDGEFIFDENAGKLLDWESMLHDWSVAQNGNPEAWTDLSLLPKVDGERLRDTSEKAEKPDEKSGPVGDFCRAYNVPEAIDRFLSHVYEEVDDGGSKQRYTYIGGTTTNGAVVEDDGDFLYSHHGSDPASDRLVNAFDLVRIHLFGEDDEGVDPDTPPAELPSWKAMLEEISQDENYKAQALASRYDQTAMFDDIADEVMGEAEIEDDEPEDDDLGGGYLDDEALDLLGGKPMEFDDEIADLLGEKPTLPKSERRVIPPPPKDWFQKLAFTPQSQILNSVANIAMIVQNDRRFRGCIEFNAFTQRVVTRRTMRTKLDYVPILHVEDTSGGDDWTDAHTNSIRLVLESENGKGKVGYGLKVSERDMELAVETAARQWTFHPVRERLNSFEWDGVERIERLFIDYLGAPDNAYTRQTARMWMVAAVARAFEPGHKFDYAVILEGAQGVGKSTFIRTLAMGWFGELTANFHDEKRLVEQMMNCWVMELPELGNLSRSGSEDVKAFTSSTFTRVRMSYARREQTFQRQCVFMGSTNKAEYLVDTTGNRRWWPMEVNVDRIDRDLLTEMLPQLWGEAVAVYRAMREAQPHGSLPLYLTDPEAAAIAAMSQEEKRQLDDADHWEPVIQEYLDTPQLLDQFDDEKVILDRAHITMLQEALGFEGGHNRSNASRSFYAAIDRVMRNIGWEKARNPFRIGSRGLGRGYIRPDDGSQQALEAKYGITPSDGSDLL